MPKRKDSPQTWTIDEFNSRVVKLENDCWILPTNSTQAHKIAYKLFCGNIPKSQNKGSEIVSMFVCHTCDNPRCCNPKHLFLGTFLDNNKDRANKDRSYKPFGNLNVMKRPDLREKRAGAGNPMFGKKHTEEAKQRIVAAHTGELSPSKRPDVRKKLSESGKAVAEIICEHCNKSMKPWTYGRYHGERCNERKN